MKQKMLVVAVALVAVVRGAQNEVAQQAATNLMAANVQKAVAKPYDIPPGLVFRMMEAHTAARNRHLNITNAFDAQELLALGQAGLTNAHEIATRPRGEMKFCDDQLSEKERKTLWPFEVEAFEKRLEAKMVRDKDGWFRLKGEFEQEAGGVNDDGLVALNPTMRWINHEIEKWAVEQLDAKFKRMDEKSFCKMSGDEKMPEDTHAWVLSKEKNCWECFVIQRNEGAWNMREYMCFLWDGKEKVEFVASFVSFPNRKEAAAMRAYVCDIAARHNLAVLEWRHRSNYSGMNPWRIKAFLEKSKKLEVPTAAENLKILFEHIPELADE